MTNEIIATVGVLTGETNALESFFCDVTSSFEGLLYAIDGVKAPDLCTTLENVYQSALTFLGTRAGVGLVLTLVCLRLFFGIIRKLLSKNQYQQIPEFVQAREFAAFQQLSKKEKEALLNPVKSEVVEPMEYVGPLK